jgi:hypothetical protein
MKEAQNLQADARSTGSQAPDKVAMTEEITNLKLIGFSIEVETDPVTLLLQTDKGPFSVETNWNDRVSPYCRTSGTASIAASPY